MTINTRLGFWRKSSGCNGTQSGAGATQVLPDSWDEEADAPEQREAVPADTDDEVEPIAIPSPS